MLRINLERELKARKMSKNKLQQLSQVSYGIISEIIDNPTKTVNTDTINRLARALEMRAIDLLSEAEEEIKSP